MLAGCVCDLLLVGGGGLYLLSTLGNVSWGGGGTYCWSGGGDYICYQLWAMLAGGGPTAGPMSRMRSARADAWATLSSQ